MNKDSELIERTLTAFADLTARLPTARVVEGAEAPPEHPATLEECQRLDELCAAETDFYELDEDGKVINPTVRHRLVSWHPHWGGSVESTGGAFLAFVYWETWVEIAQPPTRDIRRLGGRQKPQRKILASGFAESRAWLARHKPCRRELTAEEMDNL